MKKTYSIFGAGASGLYTAWRLLNGAPKPNASGHSKVKQLRNGDTLELYEWGQYDFSATDSGSRAPGARVCTWHYQDNPSKSYLELGAMRYSHWNGDNSATAGGHRVVTKVIEQLGLDQYSVSFNESTNPLYYLRTKNMYLDEITTGRSLPYNVDNYGPNQSPNTGFQNVERMAGEPKELPQTRAEWCEFYQRGKIAVTLPRSSVFQKGDLFKGIGYWNLMFDRLGSEGYLFSADGNGFTSSASNWNSTVAMQDKNGFAFGTQYKTLTTGLSSIFRKLFEAVVQLAKDKGVNFKFHSGTRLHSILKIGTSIPASILYTLASREHPYKKTKTRKTDAAWLAMPRYAIDLVAQATRYEDHEGLDVLNDPKVRLYLESAVQLPTYKVGMFFDREWWNDRSNSELLYKAPVEGYEITKAVLAQVKEGGFPAEFIPKLEQLIGIPFASSESFTEAVEHASGHRLSNISNVQLLLTKAARNTVGPSFTDAPIRQVIYIGNNASNRGGKQQIYGLLATYSDEMYTNFWKELELKPEADRTIPVADDTQPLDGPCEATPAMVKMLRQQLAAVHFGPQSDFDSVPEPLATRYMNWALPPFGAGYHAYAAHYDICDVQRKLRKPSQLIEGVLNDADIFIVGEAYSNDQAWVEGAFCTAESVLNDFFEIDPILNNVNYPFICPKRTPPRKKLRVYQTHD